MVDEPVHRVHEREDRAQRGSGVQVVGEGRREGVFEIVSGEIQGSRIAVLLRFVGEPEAHVVDALQRTAGLRQLVEGEVQLLAVVHRRQQIADRPGGKAPVEKVAQGVAIAEGLGHLLAVHRQVLRVKPVARQRTAVGRLALGDLVLVVGKEVVHAAAVDIERLAQVLLTHRRAFDVPSRPSRTPG